MTNEMKLLTALCEALGFEALRQAGRAAMNAKEEYEENNDS